MAFSSFGGMNMGGGGNANANAAMGEDLKDITAEGLGFLSISGEAKVRLLPTPWPEDKLPAPTSSLLSVASRKGLVAAAGPETIILATTESVRKAFEQPRMGDSHTRAFRPELVIPMSMRVSQLAFTADEEYLVVSAEVGGGLAVYSVQTLLQGSTQSAFELRTNGQSLRCLIPNPTPEKGELLALVTNDGTLMMANLKERSVVPGANGQILKEGVSCLSWSARGKQLVAGLGDGTASQMTPEGVIKGEIPKPPGMENNYHMSSITWLENNVFLVVHTPNSSAPGGGVPESVFHVVTRQDKTTNFEFRKITNPAGPFGMERSPPHNFILRLREFPPNLQDALIITSTAALDIGMFTRSRIPLAPGAPIGDFTMTEFSDDSRRAAVPSNDSWANTSPIGFALDLSSKTNVTQPIKGDELEESKTPLPAFMLLNNEGVLAAWWIVYNDSVQQGTVYPGLAVASSNVVSQGSSTPQQQPAAASPAQPSTVFGSQQGIGQRPSPWGTPAATSGASAFGKPAFGSTTAPANPAFGSSAFSQTPSKPAAPFGTPTFGSSSSATAPAFGSSGFAAPKTSPWSSAASPSSAFGQPTGMGRPSPFGSSTPAGTTAPASGGFASFANASSTPFAAAASSGTKESVFGAKTQTPNTFGAPSSSSSVGAFGSTPQTTNAFGAPATTTSGLSSFSTPASGAANPFAAKPSAAPGTTSVFGDAPKQSNESSGLFGQGGGFSISSSFSPDPSSAKDDTTTPAAKSLFGNNFGSVLQEAGKETEPASKDAEMDADTLAVTSNKPEEVKPSTTPASTPAPAAKSSIFGSAAPTSGGLFGGTTSTAAVKPFGSPAWTFSQPNDSQPKPSLFEGAKTTAAPNPFAKPPTTPQPASSSIPKIAQTPATPPPQVKIKDEPVDTNDHVDANIPDAPLPPDTTSKTRYSPGDTSGSSTGTDAPLPPDFIQPPKPTTTIPKDLIPPSDVPGGPADEGDDDSGFDTEDGDEDGLHGDDGDDGDDADGSGDDGSGDEGSGEDIAHDLSPTSDASKTQSSFNMSPDNTFTKIKNPNLSTQQVPKSLFGEINRQAPVLPPPNQQTSPRSPSPIRNALPRRLTRPDASRSVSAPGMASQILGSQKAAVPTAFGNSAGPGRSTYSITLEEQQAGERRKAEVKARKEAEEAQALVDDEDQKIQDFIASSLEATTTLDEFQAHVGNVGADIEKSKNVPAQVEAVYRDINSMIDTLGLNARALKCFVKGHTELSKDEGRTRDDLENPDDWCLGEVDALSFIVENSLTRELEDGCVKDVANKLDTCTDLQKDLNRLQTRLLDIRKILVSHSDPNQVALARQQPLTAEQAAQQHDLRRNFTNFQKLLAEAEEGLVNLKARIVSQAAASGKPNGTAGPTVEAVMRTITKMTSMAEKRSGDIDVLEGQMRKLRFSSLASDSREGSPQPFSTPQGRSSMRNPGSSTYGLFFTPDSSIRDDRKGIQNSFMSSTNSYARGSPGPRKKLSGYTLEEKAVLRANLSKKNEVKERLRAALKNAGTTIRVMDDE